MWPRILRLILVALTLASVAMLVFALRLAFA